MFKFSNIHDTRYRHMSRSYSPDPGYDRKWAVGASRKFLHISVALNFISLKLLTDFSCKHNEEIVVVQGKR